MNSATARYARAVVSSSSLCVHLDVGHPEADRGRSGFGEPGHRRAQYPQQCLRAASSPTAVFKATQAARPSTSTWLNAG